MQVRSLLRDDCRTLGCSLVHLKGGDLHGEVGVQGRRRQQREDHNRRRGIVIHVEQGTDDGGPELRVQGLVHDERVRTLGEGELGHGSADHDHLHVPRIWHLPDVGNSGLPRQAALLLELRPNRLAGQLEAAAHEAELLLVGLELPDPAREAVIAEEEGLLHVDLQADRVHEHEDLVVHVRDLLLEDARGGRNRCCRHVVR
eukprot:8205667-Alexandrium_andersonii.AAC.1